MENTLQRLHKVRKHLEEAQAVEMEVTQRLNGGNAAKKVG